MTNDSNAWKTPTLGGLWHLDNYDAWTTSTLGRLRRLDDFDDSDAWTTPTLVRLRRLYYCNAWTTPTLRLGFFESEGREALTLQLLLLTPALRITLSKSRFVNPGFRFQRCDSNILILVYWLMVFNLSYFTVSKIFWFNIWLRPTYYKSAASKLTSSNKSFERCF